MNACEDGTEPLGESPTLAGLRPGAIVPVAPCGVAAGIPTIFTFYRPGHPEYNWHTWLPAAPVRDQSICPGPHLGEDFERHWRVYGITWVFENDAWHLEVGLT